MKMVICFNGTPPSLHALAYGEWLALQTQLPTHLLGIVEDPGYENTIANAGAKTCESLTAAAIRCTSEVVEGRAEPIISARASHEDMLVVVGKLDRPWGRRLVRGRSIRDLLASVTDPMLYVPEAFSNPSLHHLLLCTTGLEYTSDLVSTMLPFARMGGQRLTILYVIPPRTYDYPLMDMAHVESWHDLQTTKTLVARNVQAALDTLTTEGIDTVVRVRRGYPAQEILQEIREGDYDLVGMGSHYSVTALRARFTANVTSEVAEQAVRPLLIVRSRPSLSQHSQGRHTDA